MKNFFLLAIAFVFSIFGSNAKFTIFSLNSPAFSNGQRDIVLKKLLAKEKETAVNHLTIDMVIGNDLKNFEKLNDLNVDIAIIGPKQQALLNEKKEKYLNHAKNFLVPSNFIGEKESHQLVSQQSFVFYVDNIKVGVFAVFPCNKMSTEEEKKIYYLPSSFAAKKMIEDLKKKNVDVIIAISHQSLEDDKTLVKALKDIDMIIGCHDCETISSYDDQTFIYKLNHLDSHLVRIDVAIEKKDIPQKNEVKLFHSWRDVKIE